MQPTPVLDASQVATALAGAAVPFLVQLVRNHVIKSLSPKGTLVLSVLVALACTTLAYLQTTAHPTFQDLVAHVGVAFTISQLVYRQFQEGITTTPYLQLGHGTADAPLTAPVPETPADAPGTDESETSK